MAKRRNKGEVYWYLSFDAHQGGKGIGLWKALSARECNDAFDDGCWSRGNYFTDPDEACRVAAERNAELRMDQTHPRNEKSTEERRRTESEKDVERYLVKEAAARGWLPLKYSSGITTGYPDRCILLPGGRTVWVEVKTTGEKPGKLQQIRLRQLRQLGFLAEVVDSRAGVDLLMATLHANLLHDAVQTT